MKLIEALNIIAKAPPSGADPFRVALVCGFNPLHLATFLQAKLKLRWADRQIEITNGLYGNLLGNLDDVKRREVDAVAVVIEWADLDARLGIRQLGVWGPKNLGSICGRVPTYLAQIEHLLNLVVESCPITLCLPTIPLPPLFFTSGWQASSFELQLRETLASFAARVSQKSRINVVSTQRLDRLSPTANRLDAASEWTAGFPYCISHASAVAELLAQLIQSALPKKGIITDLDNTLWNGLVGEVGAQKVYWDLDHYSQAHGLYQQFLGTLAQEGVLVGVASKNDPTIVEEVFRREDLVLPRQCVFPWEVGWGRKSEAISRILETWNVGPESVIFVDDSPAELADIQVAHPDIECIQFPHGDPQAVCNMLDHLRDRFGRRAVSEEDAIRSESLRSYGHLQEVVAQDIGEFSETLLKQMGAEITLGFLKDQHDNRAFDLVNKTNQFNLNGRRYTEASWQRYLEHRDTFMLTASYKDHFGSLGKIAVLTGRWDQRRLSIDTWVMSCRAFARRIEHQCLQTLFRKFGIEQITLDYAKSSKNGPTSRFFQELLGAAPEGLITIDRTSFLALCPKLYHRVIEIGEIGQPCQILQAV